MIEQGENIKYIQSQLSHANPTVTLNVYGHLIDEQDRKEKSKFQMLSVLNEKSCGKSVANPL